jgi:co-chaperonin GroES (HSP10)
VYYALPLHQRLLKNLKPIESFEDWFSKIMNEEIIKKDMALDIENKFTLLGDRILVQLDAAPEVTTLESGVLLPSTEVYETEGGRQATRSAGTKYLTQGTVIALSALSNSKLAESGIQLSPGDKVYVSSHSINSSFYFSIDRTQLSPIFSGLVAIPHVHIEAKLNS